MKHRLSPPGKERKGERGFAVVFLPDGLGFVREADFVCFSC